MPLKYTTLDYLLTIRIIPIELNLTVRSREGRGREGGLTIGWHHEVR